MSAGVFSFALPAVAWCWQIHGWKDCVGKAAILLACAAVLAANFRYCGDAATVCCTAGAGTDTRHFSTNAKGSTQQCGDDCNGGVKRQSRQLLVHGGGLTREGTRASTSGRCTEHDPIEVQVMSKSEQVYYA
jgi:hypothetical protein